jgi:hypothetical protein
MDNLAQRRQRENHHMNDFPWNLILDESAIQTWTTAGRFDPATAGTGDPASPLSGSPCRRPRESRRRICLLAPRQRYNCRRGRIPTTRQGPTIASLLSSHSLTDLPHLGLLPIDHVGIAVHDTAAALRLYRDLLGLRVESTRIVAGEHLRITFLAGANTRIPAGAVSPSAACGATRS